MNSERLEEFENKFRKLCWNNQIDEDTRLDYYIFREFAEEFYRLGFEHAKHGL